MPPKRRATRRGKKPAEPEPETNNQEQEIETTINVNEAKTDETNEIQEEVEILELTEGEDEDNQPVLLDDKKEDDMAVDEEPKIEDKKTEEKVKHFENILWENTKKISNGASDSFVNEGKNTALAVFIAANSENKEEIEMYNTEEHKDLYKTIKEVLNFARDYCDTCISLSTLKDSKSQVYCNSINLLAQANKQFKIMLKESKSRQAAESEKFAVIPIPSQYSFKIVKAVIQYLCFGILKVEKEISFVEMQRLVRCFEYFKILTGKESEVLPVLRQICLERQFTFAVTEAEHEAIGAVEVKPSKLILMKQVINHVEKMHNLSYSVDCSTFNNKRSDAAEAMWNGPKQQKRNFNKNKFGYSSEDLAIPNRNKVNSRSAKFGGQTDDNRRLLRTSMSRFTEKSSYVVLDGDLRNKLSGSGNNFNRARSIGPGNQRRNNFNRAQSVGATHARIERRLIARKSQPRDLPGYDNSNQINPVTNKPIYRQNNNNNFSSKPIDSQYSRPTYRAGSRAPSRGPPMRRAQSRPPMRRAQSKGPAPRRSPNRSFTNSRYNDHRPNRRDSGRRRDSPSPRRNRDSHSYRPRNDRRSRSPRNSYRGADKRRRSPDRAPAKKPRQNDNVPNFKRTIANNHQQQFGNPAPYGTARPHTNQYQVMANTGVQMGYYGGVPTQFVPVHVAANANANKYGYQRRR